MLKQQQGFTLIELMVGLVISVIVIGAAFSFLLGVFSSQNDSIQARRVTSDTRAILDLMTKDIRRAGFLTTQAETYVDELYTNPFQTDTTDVRIHDYNGNVDGCILFSYNANDDEPPAVDSSEFFGYRYTGSGIEVRTEGSTTADCDEGEWQPLSNSRVEVGALTFVLSETRLNVSSMRGSRPGDDNADGKCDAGEACTLCVEDEMCLAVRAVTIDLTTRSTSSFEFSQQVSETVRIKNDKYWSAYAE